jgi:hypothetical protein
VIAKTIFLPNTDGASFVTDDVVAIDGAQTI